LLESPHRYPVPRRIKGVVAACTALGVNRASDYRARKVKPDPRRDRDHRVRAPAMNARVLVLLDSEPFIA